MNHLFSLNGRALMVAGLFSLLTCRQAAAQQAAPNWEWLRHAGNPSTSYSPPEEGRKCVVDGHGNTYVIGKCFGNATFGAFTIAGSGFLAKYDSTGTVQWVRPTGLNGYIDDIAIGPSGSVYVTAGPGTLGDSTLDAGVNLIKCSPGGVVERVRRVGGDSWASIAVDGQENVYLARTTIGGSGGPALWVSRYSAVLGTVWVRHCAGFRGSAETPLIATDGAGNCYVDMAFGQDSLFVTGGAAYAPANGMNHLLLSLNAAGSVRWSRHLRPALPIAGTTTDLLLRDLVADAAGNCYLVGHTPGDLLVGPTLLPAAATPDVVLKTDSLGAPQWLRPIGFGLPPAPGASGGELTGLGLALTATGDVCVAGQVRGRFLLGADTLATAPGAFFPTAFVARLEAATGLPVWARGVQPSSRLSAARGVALDARANVYLTGNFIDSLHAGPATATSYGGHDIFVARLRAAAGAPDGSRLGGTVYLDANGNGTRDSGEGRITAPLVVEVQPGPWYITTNAGAYAAVVPPGSYTLSLPGVPAAYTVRPATHTATLPLAGQTDTTNHFGLYPAPNVNDLRVALTSYGKFSPGAPVQYVVTATNPGTMTATTPQVTLTLDPALAYVGSQPAATVAGSNLSWNLPPLAPFQTATLVLQARVAAASPMGTAVASRATIAGLPADATPADNTATAVDTVVASFDPNDKRVSPAVLTPAQTAAGAWLDYTIRFQNTGTDTAFRVMILDTLSAHVQPASFQFVAASHNLIWQLKGSGIVEFSFPGIQLPDSATNQLRSQGFVRYRVRVSPTLTVGDSVTNTAHIFFDANAPVATNAAVTHVQRPLGVPAGTVELPIDLYPNPATNRALLALDVPTAAPLVVRVLDALGRVVWQQTGPARAGRTEHWLPTGQWAPGVYQVQARCGQQLVCRRLVVQPGPR